MGNITFKDFQKLDIRVGTVIDAEIPKWSHWVMKLTVDFSSKGRLALGRGENLGKKTAFAGIMKHYKPEDLIGKQFAFVINLEPKKIGPEGDLSEAMLLAASVPAKSGKEEDEKPVLLGLNEKVANGTRIR